MPALQRVLSSITNTVFMYTQKSKALIDICVMKANWLAFSSCKTIHLKILHIYFRLIKELKNGFLWNSWLRVCFPSNIHTPGRQGLWQRDFEIHHIQTNPAKDILWTSLRKVTHIQKSIFSPVSALYFTYLNNKME